MKNFFSKKQRGQALVLITLAIVGTLGLAALALDGGNAFSRRRHAQGTADQAALAAALARVKGFDWQGAAYGRANDNGFASSTVTLHNPPISGPYAGNSEYIQVFINETIDTWFAPIVGVETMDYQVESVARGRPSYVTPFYDGNAMVALNPTACKAFEFSGSGTTYLVDENGVPFSGIFVNSNCANAIGNPQQAFYQGGNSEVTAEHIRVVGGAYFDILDLNLTDGLATGVPAYDDIQSLYELPDINNCGTAGTTNGSVASPGRYDSSFPPNGVSTLEPGIYCLTDGLSIQSDLSGTDVVFQIVSGGVSMNGNADIALTGRSIAGHVGRLLIYLPPTNTSTVRINGSSDSGFTGTILAPKAHCQLNGTGNGDGFNSQIICDTIDVTGTADLELTYDASENYQPLVPATVELTQ